MSNQKTNATASFRDTVNRHRRKQSQAKPTNLVTSYSPDIRNISKNFKQILYDLRELLK